MLNVNVMECSKCLNKFEDEFVYVLKLVLHNDILTECKLNSEAICFPFHFVDFAGCIRSSRFGTCSVIVARSRRHTK